jgi:EAL domain-containing protein (putative c-di-GMP-specific phosphodiesterase class I)
MSALSLAATADPTATAVLDVLALPERLQVVLQPVARLSDLEPLGYEALARFPRPGSGIADPQGCFDYAHGAGLAPALESVALQRALPKRAVLPRDCYLGANVSATLLTRPEIRAVLEDAAPLQGVVIELTERHPLGSLAQSRRAAAWLRRLGARLAIDDLGAGYAGLQWFIELEPEVVKLDRALIRGLERDARRRTVVRTLVAMCREVGATAVAEGIETPAELDAVRELEVPCGQGFLLGRPSLDEPARVRAALQSVGSA